MKINKKLIVVAAAILLAIFALKPAMPTLTINIHTYWRLTGNLLFALAN